MFAKGVLYEGTQIKQTVYREIFRVFHLGKWKTREISKPIINHITNREKYIFRTNIKLLLLFQTFQALGMTAEIQSKVSFLREAGYGKFDTIHKADLKISDIGNLLGNDWVRCAHELEIPDSDINIIKSEYPDNEGQQAMVMLRFWLNTQGNKATGNALGK